MADRTKLEEACRLILEAIGEDPTREGLVDTPRRFASWWDEFTNGQHGNTHTTFEAFDHTDQLVAVTGVNIWSLCEHHLLPFSTSITIGYITRTHVIGVSKLARIARKWAGRLQIQERLVHQIATELAGILDHTDIAVLASGQHLCMAMRGVRTPAVMTTNVMWGLFREDTPARNEIMSIAAAHPQAVHSG